MKSQISRNSRDVSKRYSGVYQQQGRMITDADWNELMDIVRERLDRTLLDVVGSGVPKKQALVRKVEGGTPGEIEIRWGCAYVDGILSEVRPDPALSSVPANFDFGSQADFPAPPALPSNSYLLYLDVWERSVSALEDSNLRDAALHGADTCTRSQTMAQVKWCPTSVNPEDSDRNPTKGTARSRMELRRGSIEGDPCDPCADVLAIDEPAGDYLFRLELHDAELDASGDPTRVTLKWSSENGAEQYEVPEDIGNLPPGFSGSDWVYEFFHGPEEESASEKHLGVHLNSGTWSPSRGELVSGFPATPPVGYSRVRRWDGVCTLTRNPDNSWSLSGTDLAVDRGLTVSTGNAAGTPGYFQAGTTVEIHLDTLILNLEMGGKKALAGDFWQAPVRTAIHEAGDEVLPWEEPAGIIHHYLAVARVESGVITWAPTLTPGEQERRFAFPELSRLTSGNVGYAIPDCQTQDLNLRALLGETLGGVWANPGDLNPSVRDALDALFCHLHADHVPLVKDENTCEMLRDDPAIRTVQDAIDFLCSLKRDGCSTYTVFPEENWYRVFADLSEGEDAHICFQNGHYVLPETAVLSNKGHLKITGCGPGVWLHAPNHEAALNIVGCASVTVRDLKIESGRSGAGGTFRHLNGALTIDNSGDVCIENVIFKCAGGSRPRANCLTVSRLEGSTQRDAVRIKGCEFLVGNYQQGILLVNARKALVEDNWIHAGKKPASLTFENLLKDRTWKANIEKLLVSNAVLVAEEDEATVEASRNTTITSGSYQIKFDSTVAERDWQTVMVANPPAVVNSANDLLAHVKVLGSRAITDVTFRNQYAALRRWYDLIRAEIPSVAAKGIVCGGRTAEEVRISGNRIEGALEAIHVGVSRRASVGDAPDVAGSIIIRDNVMRVYLASASGSSKRGIYIGNCNHLVVENNRLNVQRYFLTRNAYIEGIHIYGSLGRMVIVRQNFLSQCSVGIYMRALGTYRGKSQWLVADNMVPQASRAVVAPSGARNLNNYA